MKFFTLVCFLLSFQVRAQDQAQIQSWILESISEMPSRGGYELTSVPARKMGAAFTWMVTPGQPTFLELNPKIAIPSYCTTATYMVLYKVLQKYWATVSTLPDETVLARLKPNMENDGERIWGRWNSNGPGTAKLFHDAEMGINFSNIHDALPGDFLKMYWNNQVGKLEKGHSVIFLGLDTVNGEEVIRFWSSNTSTSGYGEKYVPRKDAMRTVFTRLTNLSNNTNLAALSEKDAFLESMLTRVSSWEELLSVTGMEE